MTQRGSRSGPTSRPSRPTRSASGPIASSNGLEPVPRARLGCRLARDARRLDQRVGSRRTRGRSRGRSRSPSTTATSTASSSATRRSSASSCTSLPHEIRRQCRGQRSDRQDPAREARGVGAGHHRRGVEYLARASRARLFGRLSRRAYPALLGGGARLGRRRSCDRCLSSGCAQAYPGKRIVIAEFGWPSAGLNRKDAVPSPLTQAEVIRDFVTRADAMGIDYSIVEAFDQPWKTNEGSVGPYWGMFDADRHPKFAFAGAVDDAELCAEGDRRARHRALAVHPDLRHPARDASRRPACSPAPPCHRRLVGQCGRLLGDALLRARLADRHVRRRRACSCRSS